MSKSQEFQTGRQEGKQGDDHPGGLFEPASSEPDSRNAGFAQGQLERTIEESAEKAAEKED